MKRNGKELGERPQSARLADAKNAWRHMTPTKRREFLDWVRLEDLPVAGGGLK